MKFTYSWLKEYVPVEMPVAELVELLTKHGVKVESYEPQGNDTLITLEITANRPDCLSLHGIAREVALLTGQKVHPKEPDLSDIKEKKSLTSNFITVSNSELCPIYIGRIIKGVKVRPSPDWLRKRVESIGLRSINNVVDITNFVLFETGQPLHTFDYNALTDSVAVPLQRNTANYSGLITRPPMEHRGTLTAHYNKIIVRLAAPGEKIMAIDGKEYQLTKDTLVIADSRRPVAIAGIMGGKPTEVTETTTDVLLESAYFQPASIRKSSRYLKLSSDSSYRFERGVAPGGVLAASDRALELILAAAGGKLVGHQEVNYSSAVRVPRCQSGDELQPTIVGSNSPALSAPKSGVKLPHYYKAKPKNVTIRLARLEKILGVSIETATVKRILKGLGFILKKEWKGQIELEAPDFRPDINLEVDIIEEIARVIGYDNIPPVAPVIEMKARTPDKLNDVIQSTRHILYGLGYNEVMTDSLKVAQDKPGLIGLLDTENNVSKYLRNNLTDGLNQVYTLNENYQKGNVIKLFEISKVYYRSSAACEVAADYSWQYSAKAELPHY
ncbi:MAG: phenylalanine--tRNA ligase subunit beta, partial [Planctomycetes bacterium]|nr:phenylalanine--tRNA ligase subunit beta [Planctomycetota bacterium]